MNEQEVYQTLFNEYYKAMMSLEDDGSSRLSKQSPSAFLACVKGLIALKDQQHTCEKRAAAEASMSMSMEEKTALAKDIFNDMSFSGDFSHLADDDNAEHDEPESAGEGSDPIRFDYYEKTDSIACSADAVLRLCAEKTLDDGMVMKTYENAAECAQCDQLARCARGHSHRRVRVLVRDYGQPEMIGGILHRYAKLE